MSSPSVPGVAADAPAAGETQAEPAAPAIDLAASGQFQAEPELVAQPSPRRIRVAWIAGEDTLERLSRILRPLAIGLLDELIELVIICPSRAEADEFPSPPLDIIRHGKLRWLGFRTRAVDELAEAVRTRKVQLLHGLECSLSGLTRQLAAMAGVKYVLSSYSLADARRLGALDSLAAGVLAASEPIRNELLDRRVAPPDKIQLLRPGVHQVRHATCFDQPQHSVVIIAGAMAPDMPAFEGLLRTFADLRDRKYDCAFFVMGDGAIESHLRARADKLHLRQDLTFVDRQPSAQLAGIFKAADIYISPVPMQQLDINALMAMAAGIPVLAAADRAGDFLIDGRTAMLYRDSSELTIKLTSLLDDKAAAIALAEHALDYLREHHSPAGMVAAMAGIYRQVTQPPTAGR